MLMLLAKIKIKLKYPNEAYDALKLAVDLYPNNSNVRTAMGNFYKEQNMNYEAAEEYLRAIELDVNNLSAHNGLISVYMETNQLDDAQKMVKNLEKKNYPPLMLKKILIDSKQGKNDNIEKILIDLIQKLQGKQDQDSKRAILSSHLNLAFFRYQNGNSQLGLNDLIKYLSFQDSIFTSDILNTFNNLNENTFRYIWLLLISIGSPITGLAFMERRKKYQPQSNEFWYKLALAEAGLPHEILEYCKYVFNNVSESDNFIFYLKAFAVIRQTQKIENVNIVEQCLDQILPDIKNQKEFSTNTIEKMRLYLRIKDFDKLEELFPKDFNSMVPDVKMIYIKFLYKKKNLIFARQALGKISLVLQESPNHPVYLYIRLSLFYLMGDFSAFEEQIKEFHPKTFEFLLKKQKLYIKYLQSKWNIDQIEKNLVKYSELIDRLEDWKITNNIPEECLPVEKLQESYFYLYCKYMIMIKNFSQAHLIFNEKLKKMKMSKKVDVAIRVTFHKEGIKKALKIAEEILTPENSNEEFYQICWREVAYICALSGLTYQTKTLSSYYGTVRFPRLEILHFLMKISFFINDYESLESYTSKIEGNIIKTHFKDNIELISDLNIFRLATSIHQCNLLINESKTTKSKLKKEIKVVIEQMKDYFNQIQNISNDLNIEKLLLIYAQTLKFYFDSEFHDKSYMDQRRIQEIYEKGLNFYPKSQEFLKRLLEFEYSKKNQISLIKTITDQKERQLQLHILAYNTLESEDQNSLKLISSQFKDFNFDFYTEIKPDLNFIFNNFFIKNLKNNRSLNINEMRALLYTYSSKYLSEEKEIFLNEIKMSQNQLESGNLNGFFDELRNLYDQSIDQYVFEFESMMEQYPEPFYQSFLLRIHLHYLKKNKLQKNTSNYKIFEFLTLDEFIEWIMNNSIKRIQYKNSQILNYEKNKEYNEESIPLIWKELAYLLNIKDKTNQEIIELIHSLLEIFNYSEHSSHQFTNFEYYFHELNLKDSDYKRRLFKLSTKQPKLIQNLFQFCRELYVYFKSKTDDWYQPFLKYFSQKLIEIKKKSKSNQSKSWKELIILLTESETPSKQSNEFHLLDPSEELKNADWKFYYECILMNYHLYINQKDKKYLENVYILVPILLQLIIHGLSKFNKEIFDLNEKMKFYRDNNYKIQVFKEKELEKYEIFRFFNDYLSWNQPNTQTPFFYQPNQELIIRSCIQNILPLLMNIIDKNWSENNPSILQFSLMISCFLKIGWIEPKDILQSKEFTKILAKCFVNLPKEHFYDLYHIEIFTDLQFLLELVYYANDLELSSFHPDYKDDLIYFQNLFKNRETKIDDFSLHLHSLFKLKFKNIENLKIYQKKNQMILELILKDNILITYESIDRIDFNVEDYSSLLCKTCTENDLIFQEFFKIGNLFFQSKSKNITMNQVVNFSKNNKNQADLSSWYETQNTESVLLQWKTITKSKAKKSSKFNFKVNLFQIYDNDWYNELKLTIKDLGIWSCIDWILELSNRQLDKLFIDQNQKSIFETDISFIFNSLKEENPKFRFTEDIQNLCKSVNNGKEVYEKAFKETFKKIASNMTIQRLIMILSNYIYNEIKVPTLELVEKQIEENVILLYESKWNDIELKYNKFEGKEFIEKISNERADIYLYKMLKKRLELDKKLREKQTDQHFEKNIEIVKEKVFKKIYYPISQLSSNPLELIFKKIPVSNDDQSIDKIFRQLHL